MNVNRWFSKQSLQQSPFWLIAVAAALSAVHLTLTWRVGLWDHFGMSLLFGFAIVSLIGDRKETIQLASSPLATLLGVVLISWILVSSASVPVDRSPFYRISPFVAGIALGLLASGFQSFRLYWRELTILFFLGIPRVLVSLVTDISPITARFSAFLLWYAGRDVSRDGVFVSLPGGTIEVYEGCSGLEAMTYLLGLSIVFMMMFPVGRAKQIILPIVAICTGFFVNSIRVALMAILAATDNHAAFVYWHEGDGSMLFAVGSVLVFGAFCFFMLPKPETNSDNPNDS
jgi:cyanoexosortase A